MHGAPVRPAFDQSIGVDIDATDGQAVERLAQKLRLRTAKVFYDGLGIGRSKQMLSSQSPQLDFVQRHRHSSFPSFSANAWCPASVKWTPSKASSIFQWQVSTKEMFSFSARSLYSSARWMDSATSVSIGTQAPRFIGGGATSRICLQCGSSGFRKASILAAATKKNEGGLS